MPHSAGPRSLLQAPLFPIAPFFVTTVWLSMANYYRVHKRAHLEPDWAREHLPWHYDHHMGRNQDANWCVTNPLFDNLLKTREPYVGTEQEAQDEQRKSERKASRARAQPALNRRETNADWKRTTEYTQ